MFLYRFLENTVLRPWAELLQREQEPHPTTTTTTTTTNPSLRIEGERKGEEEGRERMGSMVRKRERNPGLVDIVFSWSIDDIMNNDLYRFKVNPIEDTFSSLSNYLHSFVKPLIEETHADLRSNMTTLPSAPVVEIFRVQEGDKFRGPENLVYELRLEECEKNSGAYEPEIGDLIALTQVRPKCVEDLVGPKLSFHLALVEGMRDEDTNYVPILSSKLIRLDNAEFESSGGGKGETGLRLFAVYLVNLTTNLRIWKALHSGEEGNTGILNSVLRIDPNVEENCGLCSDKVESGDVGDLKEFIMALGLDESQREAVSKCIALRECKHRNSVKLIWGPPGTGKTKTIASLLFSLLKVKCRTLTCAPTNVAVLGVVKRLMGCLTGYYYGLGDVVLFGNGKRMNIIENEGLHDVFLDYRVSALLYSFKPGTGWRGSVDELIRLLQDPETQYERYLEKLKDEDEDDEDAPENGKLEEKMKKDFLKNLVKENAKQNKKKKANPREKRKSKRDGEDDENSRRKHNKDKEKVPMTFEEFFATNVLTIGERIVLCTKLLYIHMPTSCLPLKEVKDMVRVAYMLHKIQNFFQNKAWSKGDLMEKEFDLCVIRLNFLEFLISLKAIQIPKFIERYEVRNFCLGNSCLVFCTVSSSSKLHSQGMTPLDLVIIDEAAQVKECESTIPLQLPGARHAIFVGDEKQLPAMVISEFCEKARFGRSLFERLVLLGHSKHLLNVQYRMHPSISLFPNKEFYDNQIMNGRNVMEISHERRFLKEKIFGSYSFINVTNGKEEFDTRHSRKNMVEVYVVAEIVSRLYKESKRSKEKVRVGCISPYKAQVFAIQEAFGKTYSSDAKDKFSVNVRSVDGFQGGEEDIIIISTVRCNGNGSIGFLDNLKRTNVALTRARYCLWILGNAPTLQNSDSVWRRLVADAQNRGCFYNAYEDESLGGAIRNALIELGQQRFLFSADSILFKAAKWKVRFSAEFHDSLTSYHDPVIQKGAASLLEKLLNGWRHQHKDDDGICVEGQASRLIEWDVVKGVLRLVWTIEILRENSTDTQVIKVLDILPRFKIAELVKKFEVVIGDYTLNQLNRCLYKRSEGGLVLPMTWPVDQANSRSNYTSNDRSYSRSNYSSYGRANSRNNYSSSDLASELSGMNLRNDPTSPNRRDQWKSSRGYRRGRSRASRGVSSR